MLPVAYLLVIRPPASGASLHVLARSIIINPAREPSRAGWSNSPAPRPARGSGRSRRTRRSQIRSGVPRLRSPAALPPREAAPVVDVRLAKHRRPRSRPALHLSRLQFSTPAQHHSSRQSAATMRCASSRARVAPHHDLIDHRPSSAALHHLRRLVIQPPHAPFLTSPPLDV